MRLYRFLVLCFFFFKQKTAYEMRISDWSSDVCSSDLAWMSQKLSKAGLETDSCFIEKQRIAPFRKAGSSFSLHETRFSGNATVTDPTAFLAAFTNGIGPGKAFGYGLIEFSRSEEHTSELKSLMSISYAVFGLKKKKHN